MKKIIVYKTFLTLAILLLTNACEDFLDAGEPFNEISQEQIFNDEVTAQAAVTSIYAHIRDAGVLNGGLFGLSILEGLYADELVSYATPGQPLDNFYTHTIVPSNGAVLDIWKSSYKTIYMANAVLESLENSPQLTLESRNRLKGECLFLRAVIHFYMVNLFGEVPYITGTDFETNSRVSREDTTTIYQNSVKDLQQAKNLLTDTYPSAYRTRANRYVVAAFLARVHLYMHNWDLAEVESSIVLENTVLFQLEQELSNEFLKESMSTIWHLAPRNLGENTYEANNLILSQGPPPNFALNPELLASMETIDLRRSNWIGEVSNGTDTWYYPFKYRHRGNTGTTMEYSIMLRLSEQYLIRAEARAMQGNLEGAKSDLNVVRQRSGLNNTEATTKQGIMEAIALERRHELFTEHGHRWFDIRRTGQADAILSLIKPNWNLSNLLLPIPESEILMNGNLLPQNPGY